MLLLSPQSFQNQLESGDFSNGTHTSQQVVQINFCSALQSRLFFKWKPGKGPMLKSTECLLQGTKYFNGHSRRVRIENSQHFTRDTKMLCSTQIQIHQTLKPIFLYIYILLIITRSVWCCFHLCSLDVKTAMEAWPYTALCHRNPLVLF